MEWMIAGVVGAALFVWLWRVPTGATRSQPAAAAPHPATDLRFFVWDEKRTESFFDSWTVDFETMKMKHVASIVGTGTSRHYASLRRMADGSWLRLDDVDHEVARLQRTLAQVDAEILSSTDDSSRKYLEIEREGVAEEIDELKSSAREWYELTDAWVGALETAYQRYLVAHRQ